MASGTSYFNSTLYRKTMARFWPLWVLWGLIWMFLIPLNMLNQYFDTLHWVKNLGLARSNLLETAQQLPGALRAGVIMVCVFSVLAAMAVFGYLYNSRSACMMHALPMRRESLFLTQYLAGLSFLLLPLIAVSFVTMVVEMILLPGDWGTALFALLTFVLVMAGLCLFFFSFAVFCAMFTGHILALPAFYGILNGLVYVIYYLVSLLLTQFFYGYRMVYDTFWVICCTPVYALTEACGWDIRGFNDGIITTERWYLASPVMVAVYAGVGILLTVLALSVYRRRHVESAGDVVSVKLVRPVFKFGVALCSGLCLGVFTASFFGWQADPPVGLIVSALIWTAVGYFVAEMLLKKSFRVWKAWKGGVLAVAIMAFLCTVCVFDLFGVEKRVPSADSVESVTLSSSMGYPSDGGQLNLEISDPEQIEMVIRLHKAAVREKNRAEQEGGDEYIYFTISYKLKNGGTLQRRYTSVPVYRNELEQENTLTWCAQQLVQDPKLAEQMYDFDSCEKGRLTEVSLEVYNEEGYGDRLYLTNSTEELESLWQAVRQDFEEGNIGTHTLFQEEWNGNSSWTPALRFLWTFEKDEEEHAAYTEGPGSEMVAWDESVNIAISPTATHTLAWLEQMGLPGEGYQLFYSGN